MSVGALGLRPTFLLAGVAFPTTYFALSALLRRGAGRAGGAAPADAPTTLG